MQQGVKKWTVCCNSVSLHLNSLRGSVYLQSVGPSGCALCTECFEAQSLGLLRCGFMLVHLKPQAKLLVACIRK